MSNQHEGQWDDETIRTRYAVAFSKYPDVHTWGFLCWMRDDLQAQIDALRQELAGRVEWEVVEDGQYRDDPNVWQVWQGMVGVKSIYAKGDFYAGKLPDGWLLVRRLTPASLEENSNE